MLDIVPNCNSVQYQGIQTWYKLEKMAKTLIMTPIVDPENLGPENFFMDFTSASS